MSMFAFADECAASWSRISAAIDWPNYIEQKKVLDAFVSRKRVSIANLTGVETLDQTLIQGL